MKTFMIQFDPHCRCSTKEVVGMEYSSGVKKDSERMNVVHKRRQNKFFMKLMNSAHPNIFCKSNNRGKSWSYFGDWKRVEEMESYPFP